MGLTFPKVVITKSSPKTKKTKKTPATKAKAAAAPTKPKPLVAKKKAPTKATAKKTAQKSTTTTKAAPKKKLRTKRLIKVPSGASALIEKLVCKGTENLTVECEKKGVLTINKLIVKRNGKLTLRDIGGKIIINSSDYQTGSNVVYEN